MAQMSEIERFDSVQTHVPHQTDSSQKTGPTGNRRFSWQSAATSIDGQEDEFVDAAEYVKNSSRSSTLDSFEDHGEPSSSYPPEEIQKVAYMPLHTEPLEQNLQPSDTEGENNLELALKRVLTMNLEHTYGAGVESHPQYLDWVVSLREKRHYDILFDKIDNTRNGFIAGYTAVPFFGLTGLDAAHLAHIWTLSDINDTGRLTKDEFALAMHLVRMQKGKKFSALPNHRPANFVPPSLRTPAKSVPLPNSPPQSTIPTSTNAPLATDSSHPDSPSTSYDTKCCDCGRSLRDVDFCSACNASFCNQCWDRLVLHRHDRTGAGGIPHEKVKPAVAMKVSKALAPPDNENLRERLHRDDAVTSWFGIERPTDHGPPVFRDYGRLADLMADTNPMTTGNSNLFVLNGSQAVRDTRTPSLISFVGQTGAGKSTLIKLLIDLAAEDTSHFPTPVIGATGAHLPTSEDVHLYMDPHTVCDPAPLLLADCEGLEGGEREPIGAKVKRIGRSNNPAEMDITGRLSRAIKILSERNLSWADEPSTRSRNFAVENLYPRLLYTFSDVIVFVLKNPRVIEHVFERLIRWAAAALETSSNQPILPHAIIVLNASENDLQPNLWEPGTNTSNILDSLASTITRNDTFKKFAQWWRERGKTINNVEQLILCYYSSVVILRVPANGRPKLMQEQVEKLYDGMISASIAARDRKQELRMLLDAEDFQSYLHSAFNHYAGTLHSPFDFVQASFAHSPIPPDFGGNILKLAIYIMDHWKDHANAADIFQQISYLVASCIMFDAARQKIKGHAVQIFPKYLEHIDSALENFCDRHWPCEYVKRGSGVRCVNVRSGHGGKGHQAADGKVIAAGEYVSDFSFDSYHETFRFSVFHSLRQLLEQVQKQSLLFDSQERAAATIHQEKVLQVFYRHVTAGSPISEPYTSHTVCFCCLFEMPEHALPCGHILCTSCAKIYGQARGQNDIDIMQCPICTSFMSSGHPWSIHLKPKSAGVRVLLLDGGGIRGVVELEALKAIEMELGGKIPIRLLFDMVVGTSTGGIIALGLGAKCWSVDDCLFYFQSTCRKAFTARKGADLWGVGPMIGAWHHSKYETKPLEEGLKEVFTENELLFGGQRRIITNGSPLKTAVTATTFAGDRAVVFANYNRTSSEKLSYSFQRPEKVASELKIWEAARATSAAPTFFKEFHHKGSKKVYVDGAVYHNNPVRIAEQERKLIWPDIDDQYPDIVASIGTAFSPSLHRAESTRIAASARTGIIAHGTQLLGMAKNHIATSIECERIWADFTANLPKSVKLSRFVRLDPELGVDVPQLDEVNRMEPLQRSARQQFQRDSRVKTLAFQLIATLFYWETFKQAAGPENGEVALEGRILCRLPPGSLEMTELGKFLSRSLAENSRLHFVVKEQDRIARADGAYALTNDIVTSMIDDGRFEMHLSIRAAPRPALTEILLFFSQKDSFPISGFPRSLPTNDERPAVSRHAVPSSNRWAGGSLRSKQSRTAWTTPDLDSDSRLRAADISEYANPNRGLKYTSHAIGPGLQQKSSQYSLGGSESASAGRSTPLLREAFRALLSPSWRSRRPNSPAAEELEDSGPYAEEDNSERAVTQRWISSLSGQDAKGGGLPPVVQSAPAELHGNHMMPVELAADSDHEIRRPVAPQANANVTQANQATLQPNEARSQPFGNQTRS